MWWLRRLPHPTLTDILSRIGRSADNYYLVSSTGREYHDPQEGVPATEGEKFQTKVTRKTNKIIHYRVNGEPQESDKSPLTVAQLLRQAGSEASIDTRTIDKYYLQNLSDGSKYEGLDTLVPIRDGDEFASDLCRQDTGRLMMLQKIEDELSQLGYSCRILEPPRSTGADNAVVFEYAVEVGRYRGKTYQLGIGLQEKNYPEYPPHFIYIRNPPAMSIARHSEFQENDAVWYAYSCPPKDFWDGLSLADKNMKTYINRHLQRFWAEA